MEQLYGIFSESVRDVGNYSRIHTNGIVLQLGCPLARAESHESCACRLEKFWDSVTSRLLRFGFRIV